MVKYLDTPSIIVMLLTFVLFVSALFVKGITHDLFLEAGVFLVSIKILMVMHANRQSARRVEKKLEAVISEIGSRDVVDKAKVADNQ